MVDIFLQFGIYDIYGDISITSPINVSKKTGYNLRHQPNQGKITGNIC